MQTSTGNLFASPACAIPALKPFPYKKQCWMVIRLLWGLGWTVTGLDIKNHFPMQNVRARFSDIRDRVGDDDCIRNMGYRASGRRFTKYTVPERWRAMLRALAPEGERTTSPP